jgi:hypothetical protein
MKRERRSFLKMLAALPVVGLLFDRTPRPMLESSRVKITFPEVQRARPAWHTTPSGTFAGLYGEDGREVSGDGYARVPVPLAKDGQLSITFPEAISTWGTVVGVAVFESPDSRKTLAMIPFDVPKSVCAGDVLQSQAKL